MNKTLERIKKIVRSNKIRAYLIGGAVRDILLGKKDFDLDIAVEGNGLSLGHLLQKEFGGKLVSHSEFGTATLILHNMKIDLANCRKESYPGSAKLPEVGAYCNTPLQEDLKRRDFTVNTLALNLQTGSLIDLFEGKKDLENEKIRCLHSKSFIDDPTRVFRALRFAGKLGFELESGTGKLMKKAIEGGFIQKLTPKRIRNEVILILQEPKREEILNLMAEYGVPGIINLTPPAPGVFKNIEKNLKLMAEGTKWFVYLLAVIDLNNPPGYLELTKREVQKIRRVRRILDRGERLFVPITPSEVYKLFYGSGDEELVFIMSIMPEEREKVIKYMKEYRKVRLEISGNELVKLGIEKGPLYKKLLSEVLYAKLDGKVKSKEEEIRFLKNLK